MVLQLVHYLVLVKALLKVLMMVFLLEDLKEHQ